MSVKPGLTFTAGGAEIAVYSENATGAFVCLYDETGAHEIGRVALTPDGSGWRRAELPGLKAGARYGLRVEGPYEPPARSTLRRLQTARRPLCLAPRSPL